MKKGHLSVEELEKAEIAIMSFCQWKCFPEEMKRLQKVNTLNGESHISNLNPFLEGGVMRVGGRLTRASMADEAKHPLILPKHCHVSDLVLHSVHEVTVHGGRNYMLSRLRQRYWIPSAGVVIRTILSKCVVCRRLHAAPGQQQMADLPQHRIFQYSSPF